MFIVTLFSPSFQVAIGEGRHFDLSGLAEVEDSAEPKRITPE